MRAHKKLVTGLTLLIFSVATFGGVSGCGWGWGTEAFGFLGWLFSYFSSSNYRVANPELSGTLEMPEVYRSPVSLEVDRSVSGALYQEADGFTAIGLHDSKRAVTVEIVLPGREAGEWQVTAEQSGVAPFFRVKAGNSEYTSVGLGDGELQLRLEAPYPEVGQPYKGTVSGSVLGPNGDMRQVAFSFTATRG